MLEAEEENGPDACIGRSCLSHRSALYCVPDEAMRLPLHLSETSLLRLRCSLDLFRRTRLQIAGVKSETASDTRRCNKRKCKAIYEILIADDSSTSQPRDPGDPYARTHSRTHQLMRARLACITQQIGVAYNRSRLIELSISQMSCLDLSCFRTEDNNQLRPAKGWRRSIIAGKGAAARAGVTLILFDATAPTALNTFKQAQVFVIHIFYGI
ncbi:hypothetical protein J6590_003043 [Homalodisca vitripennis]|nr:hypothetical protein J6590_003043 [Homalodisca vitripennis]